jgi:leader peptidase (prepilin peptidase)/N-methyltransferase
VIGPVATTAMLSSVLPSQTMFAALMTTLALTLGSFLNVCVERWQVGGSIVSPPSHCPACRRTLAWYENIPVFGWLALRGRCRTCKASIGVHHVLIELLVLVLWGGAMVVLGPSTDALRLCLLSTLVLGITLTDLESYVIPDEFTLTGVVLGLSFAMVQGMGLITTRYFAGGWEAVYGLFVAAGVITVVGWVAEVVLEREGMGFGDATLMAMLGVHLGPARSLLTLFVASLIGIGLYGASFAVARLCPWCLGSHGVASEGLPEDVPDGAIPFGPSLGIAGLVTLLWGWPLVEWYLRTFVPR